MDNICRLCCSTKFVNNYIFDDENALFVKMSLYLPIKVFKNDQLPQKVCDRCSCKVNDFYQFCNETIEVQNRLKGLFVSSGAINQSIDLSVIKQDTESALLPSTFQEIGTQTDNSINDRIKDEPVPISLSIVKTENEYDMDDFVSQEVPSDNSEDEFLINIKKKKRGRKEDMNNGVVREAKRGRKKKDKHIHWDLGAELVSDNGFKSEENTHISLDAVKQETIEFKSADLNEVLKSINVKFKKENVDLYCCCMCFEECGSRTELMQHYKTHERLAQTAEPAPPPAPGAAPRCPRCQKAVAAAQWAEHWRRHYARDSRPYQCGVCARVFRDHAQILKHGLTHSAGELGAGAGVGPKRFACDVCDEGFAYMRCLLAHRTRAHPEALARAARPACAQCGRTFAHANSLRRHLRVHSGRRDFLCSECGKALSSREHLKFHARIHTGYKPHVCKTCGKGFVKKCNLTLHERVHSGEKPHVCSHCGKAFSQRSTLVIHERYHSGARPYSCGVCGRGFVAKGLLSMHLKSACVAPPPAPPPPLVRCHR